MDWALNGNRLKAYHVVGMSAMMFCAILVSLSKLFVTADAEDIYSVPMIVPVLMSFTMPIICAVFTFVGKHVTVTRGVAPNDWAFDYFFINSVVFMILGIQSFWANPGSFVFSLFWQGGIGSAFNCFGSFFAAAAIATDAPVGPILALFNCQTIAITVIETLRTQVVPHWM